MRYRVVCTDQKPISQPMAHAHIVGIGTGDTGGRADRRWTLNQVFAAIDLGDSFFTRSRTGVEAGVEKWPCDHCRHPTIRSSPDAVTDNNLDALRRCNWS